MSVAALLDSLQGRVSEFNLYRLCQLIEQHSAVVLGSGYLPGDDPVRLYPDPSMAFPAAEVRSIEYPAEHPPILRTRLPGLYGLESPLPTAWLDDIAQRREGHEELQGLLDLFNHRLQTQFYRIWRKYSYPATFEDGGRDRISRSLLGLVGLAIDGSAEQIATPVSRFLALLGGMRLPTRTAEGVQALVQLLSPQTQAHVLPHWPRPFPLPTASALDGTVALGEGQPLGAMGMDYNSEVLLVLSCDALDEARGWLPGGALHHDLHALLRVYLGWRCSARLRLHLPRASLQPARLGAAALYLGQTTLLAGAPAAHDTPLTLELGRYRGLDLEITVNAEPKHADMDFPCDERTAAR